jgi:hypothetical protein
MHQRGPLPPSRRPEPSHTVRSRSTDWQITRFYGDPHFLDRSRTGPDWLSRPPNGDNGIFPPSSTSNGHCATPGICRGLPLFLSSSLHPKEPLAWRSRFLITCLLTKKTLFIPNGMSFQKMSTSRRWETIRNFCYNSTQHYQPSRTQSWPVSLCAISLSDSAQLLPR